MKSTSLLIVALIILIVALVFGIEIQNDPGYLMIHIHDVVFETSVWFALAVIIVVFVIVYIIVRLLSHAFRIGTHYSKWKSQNINRKTLRLTHQGYSAFACGNWSEAEKSFSKAAKNPDLALSSYLSAARSAQAQNAFDRRDEYLNRAYMADKDAHNAILMTAAQLQASAGQYGQAQASLSQVSKREQHSSYALQLQTRIATKTSDYSDLTELLPRLRKQKILTEAQLEGLEEEIYRQSLNQAASDPDQLKQAWDKIPKQWRYDPSLLNLYTELLVKYKLFDDALPLIQAALHENWDSNLVKLYGEIEIGDSKDQLKRAQKWLNKHPKDPFLFLTLAKISFRLKLWGQCKDYCEDSIAIQPIPETYQLLGATLEYLDQPDVAMECYRKGLEIEHPLQQANKKTDLETDSNK